MERYRVRTISRRGVEMLNLNFRGKKCDIVYKERARIKSPKSDAAVIPAKPTTIESCIAISENGFFVYQNNHQQAWVCQLSKEEQTFIKAIKTANDGKLQDKEAFGALKVPYWEPRKMSKLLGNINRKLKNSKAPVKILHEECLYCFAER
jgi:hypothetical protein